MKNILVLLLSFTVYSVSAQISFKTGNVQLDTDLNSINTSASVNFGSFKADLCASYNISEKKVDFMRVNAGMEPGEIYFALEIAKMTNRPVDDIITIYEKDKEKGWGYIAKEAGIKPGSAEFHQLKNNANSKKNKGPEKQKDSHKNKQNKGQGKGKKK